MPMWSEDWGDNGNAQQVRKVVCWTYENIFVIVLPVGS
jgi:hypothetical protein